MKGLLATALLSLVVTVTFAGEFSMYDNGPSDYQNDQPLEVQVIEISSGYTSEEGELDWSMVTYDSQNSSFSVLETVAPNSRPVNNDTERNTYPAKPATRTHQAAR